VLALSQVGRGLLHDAEDTYRKLETMGPFGKSYAAGGLGDLAEYEGRFSVGARIFADGAAADLAAGNREDAALKLAALANSQLLRRQNTLAIATAERALVTSNSGVVRFLAARVFVQADALVKARTEAARISLGTVAMSNLSGLGSSPVKLEVYAKLIEAELAVKNQDARQAIRLLTEANASVDTWLGHFDLGLAYLRVPAFSNAAAEFDQCIRRRGEVLSLFGGDPTYGLFPPVLYYQGLAREGQNDSRFVESYQEYLKIRGKSTEDGLATELRRHLAKDSQAGMLKR
jgi:hypothetical protein